jgi:ubiquitin-conjugating enzyme E2 J2
MKPPAIYMITPNGRFRVNVRLCLTISDYYPEAWSPLWTVSTVLTGLLSFMVEKNGQNFISSINQSDHQIRQLAKQSWSFNLNNEKFCQYFPELANV